ncbi:hypothetical protein C9374_012050 [Naegleria lovaniensis]|uniref:CENP-V/GFA domain-containing protein n=1 Tax=Naegleria lovaniensis TaxID=51637 RepID=A0AA88GDI2_NAELO|nr:uncharacterized protein C9374_012010 [Naegleria lovaniensis]XP_044542761.1 uncharacterized protein C9374_012050 [Naegleria lovaniensis]KAG2373547.1 hypothetical protein C9374_012010 [Naegleria lovaniensis]KAG2373587.1 hypothetical protein C9374_012050 [Naegleria lovaniensis]
MTDQSTQPTTTTPKIRTGSCRCGKLTFSAHGPRFFSNYCHCHNCRKGTSAPFTLIIGIPDHQFKWTSDISLRKTTVFTENFEGYYCAECGGYVAQKPLKAPFISTLACCYDEMKQAFCPLKDVIEKEGNTDEYFFKPERHINYENRVCEVNDDLPKFMDFPQPRGSGKLYVKE